MTFLRNSTVRYRVCQLLKQFNQRRALKWLLRWNAKVASELGRRANFLDDKLPSLYVTLTNKDSTDALGIDTNLKEFETKLEPYFKNIIVGTSLLLLCC